MSATRRNVLGAALAAPLLAQFTGTASAAEAEKYGTVSDGWIEVRWTREVQAELDRLGAEVEAVAPARLVRDSRGTAVRFPVRTGNGEPSLTNLPKAEGGGALDGGVAVRTPLGTARFLDLRSVLEDGLASGRCVVNGVEVGHPSALRCGLAEALLTTDTVPLGKPLKVRINEVPLRPTPEALEMYTATFGAVPFTADTVLGYATAEGVYTPPKP
ncbi:MULTISPECIES: hypothetical protein [unclassified Streptomyces]|uniref:hypothetical protein n=1 Tax=unclassified Streptomyces TaxID=2593676 RepID=UPI00381E0BE6